MNKKNFKLSASRTKSRAQALRFLYLIEQREEDFDKLVADELVFFENEFLADCLCSYREGCQPRAYYERFNEAPLDYVCPHRELTPSMQKTTCPTAKTCSCKRYYVENKHCPPPGYPFADAIDDPCKCKEYVHCAYRSFFESTSSIHSQYALTLVKGVSEKLEEIDAILSEISTNWSVFRMPMVDRNILRMAVYEILYVDDVPTAVAVDEAVGLAKEYGGEDSSKFVNGILSKVASNQEKYGASHND